MSRVVAWSLCGVVVALAVVSGVSALPTEVVGKARPWSGDALTADVAAAFERCLAHVDAEETFTLGPAYLRDDGRLVIGAISDDTLLDCGVGAGWFSVGAAKPNDHSGREVPFGMLAMSGYEGRPGMTVVGYAGVDVAALDFRTPDGRVIPARVSEGVFLVELPGTPEYEYGDLTHEAFDAAGAVIPGR
ncbi:hypothetical protein AB0425_32115 [Actinosynnema sp. NPDC051121]